MRNFCDTETSVADHRSLLRPSRNTFKMSVHTMIWIALLLVIFVILSLAYLYQTIDVRVEDEKNDLLHPLNPHDRGT